jgi:hypothetical protein
MLFAALFDYTGKFDQGIVSVTQEGWVEDDVDVVDLVQNVLGDESGPG